VLSRQSGYIRYVDIGRLVALARGYGIWLRLERRVGHFVPAGVPIIWISKPERVSPGRELHLLAALDVGPTRTMQQDVEFGIIQIVDIALRAMSPAVNDPRTAISCVDQLSRIIIYWLDRQSPKSRYYAPPHVLRLIVPWITFLGLIDTAFDQIRHYATADLAVSLRLRTGAGQVVQQPCVACRSPLAQCSWLILARFAALDPTLYNTALRSHSG
jgi:uncharacterized membrane protein